VLTLKFPAKGKQSAIRSLKVRKEYEEHLPFRAAQDIVAGKRDIISLARTPIRVLKGLFSSDHLENIHSLGYLETVRTIAHLPEGTELELDRFRMFGREFFELEVETETPKAADQTVRALFHVLNIPCHPISKSKLGRFLELWKKAGRPASRLLRAN
jgi:uncharacterized protein YjbK